MNTEQIFSGISTSELISYQVNGDHSKELGAEILRRGAIEIKDREGKINITETDAKYNG